MKACARKLNTTKYGGLLYLPEPTDQTKEKQEMQLKQVRAMFQL